MEIREETASCSAEASMMFTIYHQFLIRNNKLISGGASSIRTRFVSGTSAKRCVLEAIYGSREETASCSAEASMMFTISVSIPTLPAVPYNTFLEQLGLEAPTNLR